MAIQARIFSLPCLALFKVLAHTQFWKIRFFHINDYNIKNKYFFKKSFKDKILVHIYCDIFYDWYTENVPNLHVLSNITIEFTFSLLKVSVLSLAASADCDQPAHHCSLILITLHRSVHLRNLTGTLKQTLLTVLFWFTQQLSILFI